MTNGGGDKTHGTQEPVKGTAAGSTEKPQETKEQKK